MIESATDDEYITHLDDELGPAVRAQRNSTREDHGGLDTFRVDWKELFARDGTEADFIVDPVLARGRSHALVSGAKEGKSLFLAAAGAATATGRPFLRRTKAVPPVPVIYVDMEMTEDDVAERMEALGYRPDELDLFHYLLLPALPPLDTPAGGRLLLEYATERRAELVILDTYSRAVEGTENESDTTRAFHRHTGQPLKAAGITWVRADHTGKDTGKGARGSSAKNDDVDIVWELHRAEGGITLHATHRRIAWVPERIALTLQRDPLRYQPTPRSYRPGTTEAVEKLITAAVPLDASRRTARQTLREAGLTIANDALGDALAWRREQDREP